MKFFMLVILFLFCIGQCFAQTSDWKIVVDEEITTAQLSTNGNYVVSLIDRDKDNLQCVNTKTGAIAWTKTIEDFNEDFFGRFIDNSTYLLANKNQYEFVNVSDGVIQKTLPIIGESWDDDLSINGAKSIDFSSTRPYFFGSVGIFYFSDGFQIVDVKERKILHQSVCEVSQVRYEYWNDKILVAPYGSCDSLFVLDTASGYIEFMMELENSDLNSRVIQHFAATKDQMFLFNEDNILCISLTNKNVNAIIGIDPEDPDVYLPVVARNELYLIVSDEDKQSLYRCSDGIRVWETQADAVPGMVDFARLYNNDKDLVVFTYQSDGKMGVHKIDMQTGKPQWSRLLFEQESIYEPGHLKASKTGAFLTAALVSVATGAISSGLGAGVFYSPNWAAIERGLTRSKSSEGYAYLLDTNNQSKLVIAMGGRIYTELKKTARDDYDGEGFVVLDLKDGQVVEHTPGFIIAETAKKGGYNAVRFMTVASTPKSDVVMGTHDVYVVSKEKVQHIPFDKDVDEVMFISAMEKEESINFLVNHDDERYDYWVLDAKSLPVREMLCARSTDKNFVFPDTARFSCMVEYNDGELIGYPLGSFSTAKDNAVTPLWKLSEDDIDDMDLGDLEGSRSNIDSLQGIRVIDGSVYLLGSDGIGKVSPDGKCRWSVEWEPVLLESRNAPQKVGEYIVYSSGEVTQIIHDTCNRGTIISEHEIDYEDVMVVTNESKEIVVIDKSEGILYGYHAK